MKTIRSFSAAPLRAVCMLAAALVLFAPSAFALRLAYPAKFNATYYTSDGKVSTFPSPTSTNGMDQVFDGNFASNGVKPTSPKSYIKIDFAVKTLNNDVWQNPGKKSQATVYISQISIGRVGSTKYSIYISEVDYDDISKWTKVVENASDAGKTTYPVDKTAKYVQYVFETTANTDDFLYEIEIDGYVLEIISNLARSVFFRGGSGTRGVAGTNGGHYSDRWFNGNFTDYTYCNGNGVTELVIPTTGLDAQGNDTGVAWYVTDFKVGHQGNAQYSLYYTTDPEPANITTYASDPRTWTLIPGADHVQEAGTKTYGVNDFATAVKYVFNTCPNWTTHLAEVEVWARDPSSITCLHPNMTDESPAWTVFAVPTCTENAFEERFCPDCGARFEREVPLSKLGHVYVATLTRIGRPDSWGSGYVTCSRTIEDPDTHETTWSCDYRIDFDGEDVDLTTLGGPPINGVVQYTDLTVSSTGAEDGGVKPIYLMDGSWDSGWGHAWYAGTLSHDEYVQYAFGTTIELTKIEYSVLNQYQTVDFYKYDPDTGTETLLKSILIVKDETEGAPGHQRHTVDFFVSDKDKKIFVDAIRMRIGDYLDSDGTFFRYIGTNYGRPFHTIVCEVHPWGTIQWAGPLTHDPTTLMILR